MVVQKLFREDLLARLGGCELAVPSLRERPEDVPLLFGYFLESWCAQNGRGASCLAVEAGVEEVLSSYSWPRNVRQLKNLTEALAIGGVNKFDAQGLELLCVALDKWPASPSFASSARLSWH